MKQKVEVHSYREDLARAEEKACELQWKIGMLRTQRVTKLHTGGRGWLADVARANVEIEKAIRSIVMALHDLDNLRRRLR